MKFSLPLASRPDPGRRRQHLQAGCEANYALPQLLDLGNSALKLDARSAVAPQCFLGVVVFEALRENVAGREHDVERTTLGRRVQGKGFTWFAEAKAASVAA
jgi:hypothetical protein